MIRWPQASGLQVCRAFIAFETPLFPPALLPPLAAAIGATGHELSYFGPGFLAGRSSFRKSPRVRHERTENRRLSTLFLLILGTNLKQNIRGERVHAGWNKKVFQSLFTADAA